MVLRIFADWIMFPILLTCAFVLVRTLRRQYHLYPYAIMAGLTSLLAGKIVSLIFQPAAMRPFEQMGRAAGAAYINNPGFPSDHILLLTVAVLAVTYFTRNRTLSVALWILVLVVGIARVLALVHTPLDIAGGVLCGLVGGVWYFLLAKEQKILDK